jgi:hypothetical protein
VITILPAEQTPSEIPQDALHLKIGGKNSSVTGLTALRTPQSQLEIVILIDEGARESLGTQLSTMGGFIQELPADTKVAVAYMDHGRALLGGPFTTDHQAAIKELHLPLAGMPGVSASPYFCLSDLAQHWPSTDAHARREVLMITDGVDNYEQHFNPDDPYVQSAIRDSIRAHLVVYPIYWRDQGRFDRTAYAADSGQNLLAQLAQATGGVPYWSGFGNPVDIQPFLADAKRRMQNQYELDFAVPAHGKSQVEGLNLKTSFHGKVDAPQQVYVQAAGE